MIEPRTKRSASTLVGRPFWVGAEADIETKPIVRAFSKTGQKQDKNARSQKCLWIFEPLWRQLSAPIFPQTTTQFSTRFSTFYHKQISPDMFRQHKMRYLLQQIWQNTA